MLLIITAFGTDAEGPNEPTVPARPFKPTTAAVLETSRT